MSRILFKGDAMGFILNQKSLYRYMKRYKLHHITAAAVKYKKFFKIVIFMISLVFSLAAQIDESEFLYRIKTNYYSLQSKGIKNFSFWVTSDMFKNNTKEIFQGKEIYPLEVIWMNPDKLFFIKQPLPVIEDSNDIKLVNDLILDLQKELNGILVDWQRFIGSGLLDKIPEHYLFSTSDDTVKIEFQSIEENAPATIRLYFGLNGLCLKIVIENQTTKQILYTYPGYEYVDKQWLCKNWRVQILDKGEITGGFLVDIISERIDGYFIPVKIKLHVQSSDKKDKIFFRNYNCRNIMINRDLKIISK